MSPSSRHAWIAIAVVALLGGPFAATSRAQWTSLKAQAEVYARQGNAEAALATIEAALKEASPGRERVEAQLTKAMLLERTGADGIEAAYAEARREAAADPRAADVGLLATNNYGAYLLRSKRAGDAAGVLRSIEPAMQSSTVPSEAKARYYYNLAQALERQDAQAEAFSRYVRVIGLDPTLTAAGPRAEELALGAPTAAKGIEMSLDLVRAQLRQQDLAGAGRLMKEACSRDAWASDPMYSALLTAVVQYFTAAEMSIETFDRDWVPVLSELSAWSRDRDKIRAILLVYAGEMPLALTPNAAPEPFGSWRKTRSDGEAFSAFTKMVGDAHFRRASGAGREASLTKALKSYALAWSLSINTDAALYLANLLLERSSEVDPKGLVLGQFVVAAFSAKGDAYLGENWADVVRLHTLLGTIFERQQKWGPPGDPRSAAFQWRHAISAQRRLGGAGSESPVLHEKLAAAYQGLGQSRAAWGEYLTAAEAYVARDQPAAAERPLGHAVAAAYTPTADEQARVRAVQARMPESPATTPPGARPSQASPPQP